MCVHDWRLVAWPTSTRGHALCCQAREECAGTPVAMCPVKGEAASVAQTGFCLCFVRWRCGDPSLRRLWTAARIGFDGLDRASGQSSGSQVSHRSSGTSRKPPEAGLTPTPMTVQGAPHLPQAVAWAGPREDNPRVETTRGTPLCPEACAGGFGAGQGRRLAQGQHPRSC